MPIKLKGSSSGDITLDVPATAGTNTLTLPAVTDTLTGIAATQTLTNKTLTSPVISGPSISGDLNYTGTLTGGTGIINIGSGQIYKDTSGNVGIGTSSPAYKLDVNNASSSVIGRFANGVGRGNVRFDGYDDVTLQFYRRGASVGIIQTDNSGNELLTGTTGAYPLTYYTNNTERMRIDSSGNVGIGTSSPLNKTTIGGGVTLIPTYETYLVNAYYNSGWKYIGNGVAWGIGNNFNGVTNGVTIATASVNAGGAGAALTWTPALNIDTSGNVGIGTASPTSFSTYKYLHVQGSAVGTGGIFYTSTSDLSVTGQFYSATGQVSIGSNTSTPLVFSTAATERARIDSSGNVGIGTASPSTYGKLAIFGGSTANSPILAIVSNAYNSQQGCSLDFLRDGYTQPIQARISTQDNGAVASNLIFSTKVDGTAGALTERARIDSSGNVLVGKTAASITNVGWALKPTFSSEYSFDMGGTTNECFNYNNTGTGTYDIAFRYQGVTKGYIRTTSTSVAFTNVSDYRLKEDVQPMTGALAKVAALKPVTYKWKVDGSDGEGFIAHELAEIVPQCVTGEKDAVDEDGNPKYQGIDTSFLVATLTAAIQEQQSIIQSLTDRVAQLEAK
jgi:hypothetical protein